MSEANNSGIATAATRRTVTNLRLLSALPDSGYGGYEITVPCRGVGCETEPLRRRWL